MSLQESASLALAKELHEFVYQNMNVDQLALAISVIAGRLEARSENVPENQTRGTKRPRVNTAKDPWVKVDRRQPQSVPRRFWLGSLVRHLDTGATGRICAFAIDVITIYTTTEDLVSDRFDHFEIVPVATPGIYKIYPHQVRPLYTSQLGYALGCTNIPRIAYILRRIVLASHSFTREERWLARFFLREISQPQLGVQFPFIVRKLAQEFKLY